MQGLCLMYWMWFCFHLFDNCIIDTNIFINSYINHHIGINLYRTFCICISLIFSDIYSKVIYDWSLCISKERWDLSRHVSCLSKAWPHSTKDVHCGHRGFLPVSFLDPLSIVSFGARKTFWKFWFGVSQNQHTALKRSEQSMSQWSESLQAIAKDTFHIILQVDEGSKIWCAAWTSEPEPYFAWFGWCKFSCFRQALIKRPQAHR